MSERKTSKIIEIYVERFEESFPADYENYMTSVRKIATTKVNAIDADMVADAIRPFLYGWGTMRRVLRRSEWEGWEGRLAAEIRKHRQVLQVFKATNLEKTNLSKHQPEVKKCYESFKSKSVLGNIGSAKALHLICPNFFPAWDNAIADGIRYELTRGNRKDKIRPFTGDDYYRFMTEIQRLMKTHSSSLNDLSKKYHKSKLKILDEFLWWAANRPMSVLTIL
jgi:hypothetical protein